MKIWYQSFSFASPDPKEAYPRILRESIAALCGADTEIIFGNMGRSIPSGHHMRVIQAYDIPEMLKNLIGAERNGYDAIIIGNALDPGLFEARQLVRIPVLSIGQTALLYAQQIATKALVIASGRKAIGIVRENVKRYGLSESVQNVVAAASDLSIKDMTSSFEDLELREKVISAFKESVTRHLTDDIDIVLPMAGILQVLLVHAGVFSIEQRPIVPGYLVTGLMAEMAAKLHKTGISTSGHGPFAPMTPDLQKQVARVWPEWYPMADTGKEASQ